jgi:hypothetical protein
MSQLLDECRDLPPRHPVHGLVRCALGHGPLVRGQPGVGPQVQILVEELSIDPVQLQTTSASITDDGQRRFGVSHLAYLHDC